MAVTSDARAAAESLEENPVLRTLARAGYAANGIVHILIGVLALAAAAGGDGDTDQSGAFKAIAAAPLGFAGLWALAICLAALGLWHAVAGFLVHRRSGVRAGAASWGRRIAEWGQGAVFLALGAIAAFAALGGRPDSEGLAESASSGALVVPGGAWVLGLVGVGIGVGGVAFVWMGVRRSFEQRMTIPDDRFGAVVKAFGIVGFLAKGVAFVIVGILVAVAAVTTDAATAGGLDGAFSALLALPFGAWLSGLVGGGLIAYGVFCFFRARYADL